MEIHAIIRLTTSFGDVPVFVVGVEQFFHRERKRRRMEAKIYSRVLLLKYKQVTELDLGILSLRLRFICLLYMFFVYCFTTHKFETKY